MSERRDDDPTGIRQILSTLGDPGPMPPELVDRITASLADEQARRHDPAREQDHANGPLEGTVSETGAAQAPTGGTVHALPGTSRHVDAAARRSLTSRLPALALAASVVVLAGAAVIGVVGRGLLPNGSSDSADVFVATSAERDGGDAEDDTAGGMADSGLAEQDGSATAEASEEDAAPNSAGDEADSAESEALAAPVPVLQASGILVTAATFRDTLVELRARSPLGHDPRAEEALASSSVASAEDAADCLVDLLDAPGAELTPRVDIIDAVRFEGQMRALIVLTDGPAVLAAPDEPASAYLVPLDCAPGAARLLLDPVHVP